MGKYWYHSAIVRNNFLTKKKILFITFMKMCNDRFDFDMILKAPGCKYNILLLWQEFKMHVQIILKLFKFTETYILKQLQRNRNTETEFWILKHFICNTAKINYNQWVLTADG